MTLTFPLLDAPIRFEENHVQELIIENPVALRQFMEELRDQVDGMPGDIVLAVQYEPRELSGKVALMTDPFHIEAGTKKLINKIQQAVVQAEFRIESKRAQRWQEHMILVIVARFHMIRHKAAKARHYDTIVVEKKYFYMSF